MIYTSTAHRPAACCATLAAGLEVCVTVTHVDGLVLARSAFNHSVNYRSVVVLGESRAAGDQRGEDRGVARFHRASHARTMGRDSLSE